ncbi:MAG TPA: zinc-binding alcohol dehydrogenase family protein, partial [Lacipirellulaceae bacterium]|nr:zinc-binding alcohol dehydrogenase family protein [Lacipirellulaceae bacterium]
QSNRTLTAMKAIQLEAPRKFKRLEIGEPSSPGPDEALVRTQCVGVCGTDTSAYLGKFPLFSYPRIPGHELGVEVLEVGSRVENVRPGDRCSVEPYINNPASFASRRGCGNCCQDLQVLGVHVDGGLRDRFALRADKLHPSKRLAFEQLALVETLAIGCHAINRAAPRPGDHLLIIGAGPIGLSVLEFARLAKNDITVMDMNADRLSFCRRTYGLSNTILFKGDGSELEQMKCITGGELYPVVIDATGSATSMNQALNYVANAGTLVYVGITTQDITFPDRLFHTREITLKATRNALPDDFRRIVKHIEDGQIDTTRWITHRTNIDEMIDVFDSYTKPETGVIKAMIAVT